MNRHPRHSSNPRFPATADVCTEATAGIPVLARSRGCYLLLGLCFCCRCSCGDVPFSKSVEAA